MFGVFIAGGEGVYVLNRNTSLKREMYTDCFLCIGGALEQWGIIIGGLCVPINSSIIKFIRWGKECS